LFLGSSPGLTYIVPSHGYPVGVTLPPRNPAFFLDIQAYRRRRREGSGYLAGILGVKVLTINMLIRPAKKNRPAWDDLLNFFGFFNLLLKFYVELVGMLLKKL